LSSVHELWTLFAASVKRVDINEHADQTDHVIRNTVSRPNQESPRAPANHKRRTHSEVVAALAIE
jgi:hypothetical protein